MSQADAAPKGSQLAKRRQRNGVIAGLFCYLIWGNAPLYWALLSEVNSIEIICHRVIWCFVLSAVICKAMRVDFLALVREPRARRYLIPAAILITSNWSIYIYAVVTGHVVETAIGYYINPLVSILLGMVVFKERLTRMQGVAVLLCLAGIIYFTVSYGQFPAIALLLAGTFGVYGAVKKKGGYPPVQAIAVENLYALPVAIVVAIVLACVTGQHAFLGDVTSWHGWALTLLLVGAGPLTAVPLFLFAWAANDIPLHLMGFIQYLSPTIALLNAVFVLGEPFTTAHAVCFGCIWTGLALVSVESAIRSRRG